MQPNLLRRVRRTLVERKLLGSGDSVVVAVSGGPDSVALLYLLQALADEAGLVLQAAHLNHMLRGEESDRDAELAAEHARALGLPFVAERADVRRIARQQHLSIEHAARICRYRFLYQVAAEHQSKIALGHTADDQAEEVLLRLLRGSGRKGLGGMAFSREQAVIRPLLDCRKEQILRYLEQHRIRYRLDGSNTDRQYLRNRVRLDLLPLLEKEFNPAVRRSLLQTAAILADEDRLLADLAEEAAQSIRPQGGSASPG